jgi:hypothetical protein
MGVGWKDLRRLEMVVLIGSLHDRETHSYLSPSRNSAALVAVLCT